MAHVITAGCIECGRCVRECPEEAIYQGHGAFIISPAKCVDCGLCVDECPLELITPDYELEPD